MLGGLTLRHSVARPVGVGPSSALSESGYTPPLPGGGSMNLKAPSVASHSCVVERSAFTLASMDTSPVAGFIAQRTQTPTAGWQRVQGSAIALPGSVGR